MPVILLIIVIALISLYFYLDLKKVKLVNEELEKKNEVIVKEIDNIHLRLHKFFSGMPRGVVPMPKTPLNNSKLESNVKVSKELSDNKEVSETVEKIVGETIKSSEISENEFNNLKKNSSNNIFGEIEDIISNDNNIIQEKDPNDVDVDIVLPELVPVVYNSDKISEVKEGTDEEADEEVDEVDDVSEEDNSDDEELSDDLDEDLLDKYMKNVCKRFKRKMY